LPPKRKARGWIAALIQFLEGGRFFLWEMGLISPKAENKKNRARAEFESVRARFF
jgi:hypothetical protein